jgi:hypothetical protein
MPQLSLHFIDIPIPQQCLWEELHPEQQQLIIETLARLLLKAAAATPAAPKEMLHD